MTEGGFAAMSQPQRFLSNREMRVRKAEFDRPAVLRSAMSAFQARGYRQTTMQHLVAATGLHPGSLYCAFGNKRGVLLAALTQYEKDAMQKLERCFSGVSELTGIKNYLHQIVDSCAACGADNICLVARALNEMAEQDDEVRNLLSALMLNTERRIAQAFSAAAGQQRLPGEQDAVQRARFFMLGTYGLRTYAHTRPGREVLLQLAAQLWYALTGECMTA